MKSLLVIIFILVGSFSHAKPYTGGGIDYDFSPFPLKDGEVVSMGGLWGSEASTIELEVMETKYWDMPILKYIETNHKTGMERSGFAWVAHSKNHYWLSLGLEDGTRVTKRLYFGFLTGAHNFSKNCGRVEQVFAIMVLDKDEDLMVPGSDNLHIESRSLVCDF